MIAAAANASTAPVAILLPLGGVSMLDTEGGAFWDPDADRACFQAIKDNLKPGIDVVELDGATSTIRPSPTGRQRSCSACSVVHQRHPEMVHHGELGSSLGGVKRFQPKRYVGAAAGSTSSTARVMPRSCRPTAVPGTLPRAGCRCRRECAVERSRCRPGRRDGDDDPARKHAVPEGLPGRGWRCP